MPNVTVSRVPDCPATSTCEVCVGGARVCLANAAPGDGERALVKRFWFLTSLLLSCLRSGGVREGGKGKGVAFEP